MDPLENPPGAPRCRVLVLGATGTAGRATAAALVRAGHEVVCFQRGAARPPQGAVLRLGDVCDAASVLRDGIMGEHFDAVVSCLASRSGVPADAWAVDYHAQGAVLSAARRAGIGHFVLLSAICVQKPRLAFQHAKLAFEAELIASGLTYSIVRPTAFFKSLSGQIDRVRRGKSYLMFGDGQLTACKPISDADLGDYIAGCVTDPARRNRVLPIGGPGPAITPLEQGEALFGLLGRAPRYTRVPVRMIDIIGGGLRLAGRAMPSVAAKGELARIGRYYATESMLVWDAVRGRYDADATPETGSDRLFDFYARAIMAQEAPERGDHAVF